MAVHDLDELRDALERHCREGGCDPVRLEELEGPSDGPDQAGRPVGVKDPWRRPYQYRVEGDGCIPLSLGPAGRVGLDADLFGTGMQDFRPAPRQFAFELPTGGMWPT